MKKRSRLYILIACLVLGLSFELFKSLKPDETSLRKAPVALAGMDIKPFHMSAQQIEKSTRSRRSLQVSNVKIKKLSINDAKFPTTHEFAELNKSDSAEPSKANTKENDKGKEEKKKEEKKAEEENKEDTEENLIAEEEIPAEEVTSPEANNSTVSYEAQVFAAQPEEDTEGDEQASVTEWVEAITLSGNDAAMNEFISEFQKNRITSSVFFAVLEELLFFNDFFQLRALEVLNITPRGQSFDLLNLVVQKSDNEEHKAIARKAIDRYRHVNMIKYLSDAVSITSNLETATTAVELGVAVAQQFFENLPNTQQTQSTDPDADLEQLALIQEQNTNLFRDLSSVITARIDQGDLGNEFLVSVQTDLQNLLDLIPDVVVAGN